MVNGKPHLDSEEFWEPFEKIVTESYSLSDTDFLRYWTNRAVDLWDDDTRASEFVYDWIHHRALEVFDVPPHYWWQLADSDGRKFKGWQWGIRPILETRFHPGFYNKNAPCQPGVVNTCPLDSLMCFLYICAACKINSSPLPVDVSPGNDLVYNSCVLYLFQSITVVLPFQGSS